MDKEPLNPSNIVLYQTENGNVTVSVIFEDETFWLTQKGMVELFDVNVPAISKHLQNIYEEGELVGKQLFPKRKWFKKKGSVMFEES